MPLPASVESFSGDVTVLLRRALGGDNGARTQLFDLMYPELKRLAEHRMRAERPDHTLQPSALVNEFFLELARTKGIEWRDRTHFLAIASKMMRRFLIDYSRGHNAQRRGGGMIPIVLQEAKVLTDPVDAIVLDELLERLAEEEPRMAQVVDLRCFGGLLNTEIAELLGVNERTVVRDWKVAIAWLKLQMAARAPRHDP